tara:strand:- start:2487 stop:2804 length:318 start_codon:yes stop_codon:yes gene_type:complete
MNTVLKDWQIVSIFDNEELVGVVLWGIVVDDRSCRYKKDDYVCTSKIQSLNEENQIVFTSSGSVYQILGDGIKAEIQFDDFELLRTGFTPQQIQALISTNIRYLH